MNQPKQIVESESIVSPECRDQMSHVEGNRECGLTTSAISEEDMDRVDDHVMVEEGSGIDLTSADNEGTSGN